MQNLISENYIKFYPSKHSYTYTIIYYLLAAVLIAAGLLKIYDISGMMEVLSQLTFISEAFVPVTTTILPVIELGVGIALAVRYKPIIMLGLAAGLFLAFLGFSLYGALAGLQGDCGCFGSLAESYFGWEMVLRNCLLFCAAGFLWVRS